MNAKFSAMALALLGSAAMAATATVWTEDGPGTMAPASWYSYTYGTGASVDTMTTTANVKVAEFSVTAGKSSNGAGYGFTWKQDANNNYADLPVSLTAYKGVCLTYRATAPFRIDFKQSTITDDNYYGAELTAGAKRTFIAFSSLEQGWTSKTTVAWNVGKQTGVQFGYKNTHATTSVNTNTVEIVSFILADECENHAPNLVDGVSATVAKDLYEGDTLQVAFKGIFEDADGDDLNITLALSGYAKDLVGSKSYSMSDIAKIKSKANPIDSTEATAIFTAKDPAGKSVTYTVKLNLIDRKNAPVAVNDNYEVNEDDTLTVGINNGIFKNDYDDDGDETNYVSHTDPAHGKIIKFNELIGNFTYVPDPDFYGTDEFTYTIADKTELTSTGKVIITVKNVNDPAVVTIKDPTAYFNGEDAFDMTEGITVKEDFEEFALIIPVANIEFSDPDADGSVPDVLVKSEKGYIEVELSKLSSNYMVAVSPIADANGKDAIKLFVVDGKDSVGISIPVTITPVADKPKAVDDTYSMLQDSTTSISAAKGVLKNDLNPDGESTLKAYLATEAAHGTVKLATNGSFTYEVGAYEGEDTFEYFVINAEGDTSNIATVTLDIAYRNRGPQVVAGTLDSIAKRLSGIREDFSSQYTYTVADMRSWFVDPEGETFTLAVSNPDSILDVTLSTARMTIKSRKNTCGVASLNVTATDASKNSTVLKIPVDVECVNDLPTRLRISDTVAVPRSGWRKAFYVFDLFEDVDDSVLTMTTSDVNSYLKAEIVGDSMIVSLAEERLALQDKVPYLLKVTATDEKGGSSVAMKIVFLVDNTPIPYVATAAKMNWQGAIRAEQGSVAIFDMQGRVMWQHRLPVSEADVRNAAAQVQGRKILQVNKQIWTIK